MADDPLKLSVDFDAPGAAHMNQTFGNVDFKTMDPKLFAAAVENAEALMKIAKDNKVDIAKSEIGQIVAGFKIDAVKNPEAYKDALAAVLLSESMDTVAPGVRTADSPQVISRFTNDAVVDLHEKPPIAEMKMSPFDKPIGDVSKIPEGELVTAGVDPRATFAIAAEIMRAEKPAELPAGTDLKPDGTPGNIIDRLSRRR